MFIQSDTACCEARATTCEENVSNVDNNLHYLYIFTHRKAKYNTALLSEEETIATQNPAPSDNCMKPRRKSEESGTNETDSCDELQSSISMETSLSTKSQTAS